MFNFFKKSKIKVDNYLKFFEDVKIVDDGIENNKVENHVICTGNVYNDFKISKITSDKNKGNYKIDFNNFIDISSNYSYDTIRDNWGAALDNDGIVEVGQDEEGLCHLWFDTQYYPPYKIIDFFIKKYKNEIIWFSKKWDLDPNQTKTKIFFYKKGNVCVWTEKDKTAKEKEQDKNNHYKLGYFIPNHAVYKGNYVDAYAENSDSPKYICSCQKQALKNKLLMFDEYLVHDYCLNDRKELLLKYLGLPAYYEDKIKKYKVKEKYLECFDLFEFDDNLCYICNRVKPDEPSFYLKNGVSKFKQLYRSEFEKQYSINGLVDGVHAYQSDYYSESLLTDENKQTLIFSNEDLLKELYTYDINSDIDIEFSKYVNLPQEVKKCIQLNLHYTKNGETFNSYKYAMEHNIHEEIIDAIQDIYYKKIENIKKQISANIHQFDKHALNNKTIIDYDFGIFIDLYKQYLEETISIEIFIDKLFVHIYKNNKEKVYECDSSLHIFTETLEILSDERLNMIMPVDIYDKFIIHNGKKQNITKKDGIIGDYTSAGINHALLYLKQQITNEKIIKLLEEWMP